MALALRLPILPVHARRAEQDAIILASPRNDPFDFAHRKHWGPRARWLLSAVLAQCRLRRDGEIAILTTSDWTYVSTCLSVTAFNFSRISRVVTEQTRVVIVDHEFGYVYRDIAARAREWKERGIVVIEDCAQLIGLSVGDARVGSFGDFALFSLSKLFPTPVGGLLLTNRPFTPPEMTGEEKAATATGIAAAEKYLPHHQWFSAGRLERHRLIKEGCSGGVWEPSPEAIPFATYVRKRDDERAPDGVEFLSTLSNEYRLVPTNPLVDADTFRDIAQYL